MEISIAFGQGSKVGRHQAELGAQFAERTKESHRSQQWQVYSDRSHLALPNTHLRCRMKQWNRKA